MCPLRSTQKKPAPSAVHRRRRGGGDRSTRRVQLHPSTAPLEEPDEPILAQRADNGGRTGQDSAGWASRWGRSGPAGQALGGGQRDPPRSGGSRAKGSAVRGDWRTDEAGARASAVSGEDPAGGRGAEARARGTEPDPTPARAAGDSRKRSAGEAHVPGATADGRRARPALGGPSGRGTSHRPEEPRVEEGPRTSGLPRTDGPQGRAGGYRGAVEGAVDRSEATAEGSRAGPEERRGTRPRAGTRRASSCRVPVTACRLSLLGLSVQRARTSPRCGRRRIRAPVPLWPPQTQPLQIS